MTWCRGSLYMKSSCFWTTILNGRIDSVTLEKKLEKKLEKSVSCFKYLVAQVSLLYFKRPDTILINFCALLLSYTYTKKSPPKMWLNKLSVASIQSRCSFDHFLESTLSIHIHENWTFSIVPFNLNEKFNINTVGYLLIFSATNKHYIFNLVCADTSVNHTLCLVRRVSRQ